MTKNNRSHSGYYLYRAPPTPSYLARFYREKLNIPCGSAVCDSVGKDVWPDEIQAQRINRERKTGYIYTIICLVTVPRSSRTGKIIESQS